tara:strand:+ start:11949 stop:13847 length:1899 start_codon:yes stop_codon:yes gene_type:complete
MEEEDINLDELWIKPLYENRKAPEWPPWEMFICWYLRFLIFCDQCHDFLENDDRNEWSSQKKYVYQELEKDYLTDIEWIQSEIETELWVTTTLPPELKPENIKSILFQQLKKGKSETLLMGDYIDNISKRFLGIDDFNLVKDDFSRRSSNPCSQGAQTILKFINIASNDEESLATGGTILAVDADKSKFRLSSFLHHICQMITDRYDFNLANMMATKYDSASGSGTQTFINAVETTMKTATKSITEIHPKGINISVQIRGIVLIEYKINPLAKLKNREWKLKHKSEFFSPHSASNSTAFEYAKNNNIDMRIPKGTLGNKGEPLGDGGFLKFDSGKKFWNMYNVRSQDERNKKVITLEIKQFFKKKIDVFSKTNQALDSRNTSVKSLTKEYLPIEKNVSTVVCYKTLGDLGQILEYFTIYNKGSYGTHLFLTFDRICSRISSIFNRFTIFESQNDDEIVAPLHAFIQEGSVSSVAGLLNIGDPSNTARATQERIDYVQGQIKDFEDRADTANILVNLEKRQQRLTKKPYSRFGKKPKVSIRNTSTRVLKAKLKSVGIPLSKVIRGKRMKLTRKQLEMKADGFKRLQLRCQKSGISLTYVSKKGRKYKSAKRLLNDLKRKFKPKPKIKPKMKWG